MKTFILIDTANTFFRARHTIRGDAEMKLGMGFHVMFSSIKKAWQDFNGDHVVFCLEGRSWRKDVYLPYKVNRQEIRDAKTQKEQEEDELFWEAYETFTNFLNEKTNCTTLKHPRLEADDLIAGFIQSHPNDKHIIISTDSDFVQLLAPNVSIYNGVSENLITLDGIFNKKGKRMSFSIKGDSKIKVNDIDENFIPERDWSQFALFLKCMRGDTGDNIFSAFPGARIKGTKNKIGLTEAFHDRNSKGWAWNNIMLQRWIDHNKIEHRVLDDYERNQTLIDLTKQPAEIRNLITETIDSQTKNPKNISQVGIRLLKFCQLYDLKKIMDSIQIYAEPFQAKYP